MAGCNVYATDTVTILRDEDCDVLPARFKNFSGYYNATSNNAELNWSILNNAAASSFIIEASIDGASFREINNTISKTNLKQEATYNYNYLIPAGTSAFVDFRIKMLLDNGAFVYTRVLRINLKLAVKAGITIAPNPVRGKFQLTINTNTDATAKIFFLDMHGRPVMTMSENLKKGMNVFAIVPNESWQPGVYNALVTINQESFTTRFVVLE
jgi:hypothetical protein